eukprot:TRINITY_DN4922_c0_g1_i2.p1 TRINITY_DN4922_c0_g1~~TRINITY_DN4922_c0_g1_i2.p1  ORF type:complete len:718 (-),score=118.81 TRINITY_DN4922_c0_g1_i2:23-2176(-)
MIVKQPLWFAFICYLRLGLHCNGQAQFSIDWSQVTSSGSPSDDVGSASFGACVCDLTVARCDARCCCDGDCTADEVAMFRNESWCVPDRFGPGPAEYCVDGSLLRAANRIDAVPVGHRLCVRVDNNPLLGRALSNPGVVTDSSALGRLLQAAGGYSFASSFSPQSTSTSATSSYSIGQAIGAVGGLGIFSLPAAARGFSDRCLDASPAVFMSAVLGGTCWRQLTTESDCLGPGVNPAAWFGGLVVARFPGDTVGVPLQLGTVAFDGPNRTIPDGSGGFSATTSSVGTTAASQFGLTTGGSAPGGGNSSTAVLPVNGSSSTGRASTGGSVPTTGTTGGTTAADIGTTAVFGGTGSSTDSNASGWATSNGAGSTGIWIGTTGAQLPPAPTRFPPNSTFDAAAGLCHNSLLQVLVTFVHNGGGVVTGATADFLLGSRSVTDGAIEQSFLQSFVRNDLSGTPLHRRSGRPGYRTGEPVLVGFSQVGPGGQIAIAQSADLAAGIYLPGMDRAGRCAATLGPRVTFGDDSVAGCTLQLLRSQLGATGCVAVRAAVNAVVGAGPWTHVGIFGDADYQHLADWVPIDKSPLDSSGTAIDTATTCRSVVREVHYSFIYASVGSASNPQAKLIGATIRYVTGDVNLRCAGGVGCATGANSTQSLELRAVVSFVPYPGQTVDPVVATPPPLIPPLPRDIFYPFLISKATVLSWSVSLWTVLRLFVILL